MKKLSSNIIIGLLLILGGILFLFNNLGVFIVDAVWPFLFGLAALPFLYIFVIDRGSWWAILPASALVGLAALMFYDMLFPFPFLGDIGGALFLGSLGLGFFIIYLRTALREWWAIIPGGVLLTLTSVIFVDSISILNGSLTSSIFMLGLGVTFALVYIAPTPAGRNRWAAIPAGILGAIGLVDLLSNTHLISVVIALGLIAVGIYLLLQNSMRRRE